jgi:hypothetical protein
MERASQHAVIPIAHTRRGVACQRLRNQSDARRMILVGQRAFPACSAAGLALQ